jgi:hypothetical protein
MFRSCTASLSSKTLARSAGRRTQLLISSTRRYSDVPKETNTDEVVEEVKEAINGEIKPDSELASKLKAKEAEVVDLTVCFLLQS